MITSAVRDMWSLACGDGRGGRHVTVLARTQSAPARVCHDPRQHAQAGVKPSHSHARLHAALTCSSCRVATAPAPAAGRVAVAGAGAPSAFTSRSKEAIVALAASATERVSLVRRQPGSCLLRRNWARDGTGGEAG